MTKIVNGIMLVSGNIEANFRIFLESRRLPDLEEFG